MSFFANLFSKHQAHDDGDGGHETSHDLIEVDGYVIQRGISHGDVETENVRELKKTDSRSRL